MIDAEPDRRVRRTEQLLLNAFSALLGERRYDDITVQAICDRANIGRSTFYAHVADKDALLARTFAGVLDALTTPSATELAAGVLLRCAPLFAHIQEHLQFYRALQHSRGVEVLFESGQAHIRQTLEVRLATRVALGGAFTVPLPLLAHSIASTLFSLITWWLAQQMRYTPHEMDTFFQAIVMRGVPATEAA